MNLTLCKTLMAAALAACPFLGGCDQAQQTPPPPTPQVSVITLSPQIIVLTTELPGRTTARLVSDIRPQVTGLIQKRLFTEGSDVKAGQELYHIDPAPFQAAFDSAAANVAAAIKAADRARAAVAASLAGVTRQEATVALAKTNRQRFEDLFKDKAVSETDRDHAVTEADVAQATLLAAKAQLDSDRAAVAVAEAAIKQAEAALETARINLNYTKITAPISGRIGKSYVTEGAYVAAYQVVLATIQQLDPIYVDVPQSTRELARLRRHLEIGQLNRTGESHNQVRLVLEDGSPYPHPGTLEFRDVTVDPSTGSVILRVTAPNPHATLLPGMFLRAIIEEGANPNALLVPQQAVSFDPKGNPFVLIVDNKGIVHQKSITTDRAIGDQWLVSSGLTPGNQIIMEGLQKVRDGTTVTTVPFMNPQKPATSPTHSTTPASPSN